MSFKFSILSFQFWRILAYSLFTILYSLSAEADITNRITLQVTVTNAPTVNGQMLTVNSDIRTWTNNPVTPSSMVLTNSGINGAATNLFNQIALSRFLGILPPVWVASNSFTLTGAAGQAMNASASAGWASLGWTTQLVANAVDVRVPMASETPSVRTNNASQLASDISNFSTNAISTNTPATAQLEAYARAAAAGGGGSSSAPTNRVEQGTNVIVVVSVVSGTNVYTINAVVSLSYIAAQLGLNFTTLSNLVVSSTNGLATSSGIAITNGTGYETHLISTNVLTFTFNSFSGGKGNTINTGITNVAAILSGTSNNIQLAIDNPGSSFMFIYGGAYNSISNATTLGGPSYNFIYGGRSNLILGGEKDAYVMGGTSNNIGDGANLSEPLISSFVYGDYNYLDGNQGYGVFVDGLGNHVTSQSGRGHFVSGVGNIDTDTGAKNVFILGASNRLDSPASDTVAIGFYAAPSHKGAWVIADDSATNLVATTDTNQLLMRFAKGVAINTNSAGTNMFNVGGTAAVQTDLKVGRHEIIGGSMDATNYTVSGGPLFIWLSGQLALPQAASGFGGWNLVATNNLMASGRVIDWTNASLTNVEVYIDLLAFDPTNGTGTGFKLLSVSNNGTEYSLGTYRGSALARDLEINVYEPLTAQFHTLTNPVSRYMTVGPSNAIRLTNDNGGLDPQVQRFSWRYFPSANINYQNGVVSTVSNQAPPSIAGSGYPGYGTTSGGGFDEYYYTNEYNFNVSSIVSNTNTTPGGIFIIYYNGLRTALLSYSNSIPFNLQPQNWLQIEAFTGAKPPNIAVIPN